MKLYRLMSMIIVLKEPTERIKKYKIVCKNHKIFSLNYLWELDTKYVFIAEIKEVFY